MFSTRRFASEPVSRKYRAFISSGVVAFLNLLGRSGLRWFRAERPSGVALGPSCPGECALTRQFRLSLFLVARTRERRHEGNEIVDITLRQSEWLDVLVEIRILQAVAFVVMIDHIPKRLLRTVVKVRSRHQHVAYVGCF